MARPGGAGPRPRAAHPRRFIVFYTPNGTVMKNWRPSGDADAFTLSPILQPLEPFKQELVIVDGVDALSAYHGPGDAHQKGTGQALTGTQLQEGNFKGSSDFTAGWADGISIDQKIADAIAGSTKFRSLEFGVRIKGATVSSRISYRGPAQPLPPEVDPAAGFARIFGDLHLSADERARKIAERRRVLDAVAADYERLLPRVGAADRIKLEAHLEAVRDIEGRLESGYDDSGVCAPPELSDEPDLQTLAKVPALGKLQMDLLAMAIACDLTRVASIMWANSSNIDPFPWLSIHEAHHELSHRGDGDDDAQEKLTKINTWYAEQFAYLLARLRAIPEGDGTVLDNTLVVWVNEHQKGNNHDRSQMPYVLAGKAGGAVKTGRWLRVDGEVPHNNLWVGCMHAMRIDEMSFGNPKYCTGALSLA
ncbi:DUF1552 domain-containing protein [Nannocystis pusilla]|uniref:DUF1552 domain-containing protein n=1 Tax=Nannocystis pusilla TaxID=889268 RepID=UPI003BF3FDA8